MMQPLRSNPTRILPNPRVRFGAPLALLLPATLALGTLLAGCHASVGPQPVAPPRRTESARTPSPLERGFDVESYAIDLDVDAASERLEGTCSVRYTVDAELLEQLTFDLAGLELYGALGEGGERLAARQEGSVVTVDLDEPRIAGDAGVVHLRYGGSPVGGLEFLGRRGDGAPAAMFTPGGPESARAWFPCVDHPYERATTELTLHVPADWRVLASGERVEGRNDGSRQVEVWRLAVPHAAHRFGVAAGVLADASLRDDLRRVERLAPAELVPDVEASLAVTSDAIQGLERVVGMDFPYATFSQAVLEGLPSDTIAFASFVLHDASLVGDARARRDASLDSAEELAIVRGVAAQWCGGLVEAAGWGDAWAVEGLADYAALLWLEETRGEDQFAAALRARQVAAAASGDALALGVEGGVEAADRLGDSFRERSSSRVHLLRERLGDRAFRNALRTFLVEFPGRPRSTDDFLEALERVGGADLAEFREDWIDAAGHPIFDVSWSWQQRRGTVLVNVAQRQPSSGAWPEAFRGELVVEVRDDRGVAMHQVDLRDRRERFELATNGGEALAVRFDVREAWPKTIARDWDGPECLLLSRRSEDAAARHDACAALGEVAAEAERARVSGSTVYVAELTDRLERDSSPWVRACAARSLGVVQAAEARQRLLRAAENDRHAGVRVAALEALAPSTPDPELAALARRVFDAGHSWATMGAAARLFAQAEPAGALPWLEDVVRIPSSGDRLAVGVLDAMTEVDSPRVRLLLVDVMQDEGRSVAVRGRAARLLAAQRFDRDTNARAIAELLASSTPRLRRSAVDALASMGLGTARRALEAYYPEAGSATERRVIEGSLSNRRPLSRPAPRRRP